MSDDPFGRALLRGAAVNQANLYLRAFQRNRNPVHLLHAVDILRKAGVAVPNDLLAAERWAFSQLAKRRGRGRPATNTLRDLAVLRFLAFFADQRSTDKLYYAAAAAFNLRYDLVKKIAERYR